jgi:hypothetical protein
VGRRKTSVLWTCERDRCNNQFQRYQSYIRRGIGRYCSIECSQTSTREYQGRGEYLAQGYRYLTSQQGHPLALLNGELAEHRKILYDAIGPGPHECHWCPKMLDWGGHKGITIDHLDFNKLNNNLSNLVVSCRPCHASRRS